MKILIDEGVPVQITKALTAYTVDTVQKRGWGGIGNGDLLLLAEKHYNLFITADKNLKYQQNLTGRTVSILVLHKICWTVIYYEIYYQTGNFSVLLLSQYNMRVLAKKTLREFWEKHKDAEQSLKAWYSEASKANWKTPTDIKNDYVKASIVGDNRVVFNICGNKYRLVVKFNYHKGWAFIRFIGTHSEYDKIDVERI